MINRVIVIAALLLPAAELAWAQSEEQPGAAEQEEQERQRVRRLRDSLAVDPSSEWVPNLQGSDIDVAIERKLTVAQRALRNGDLVSPPSGNALFFYLQVLELDPENREANEGVGRVADELVRQARAAQEAGDRETALGLISTVRDFRPNYPGLRTLEDELSRRDEIDALLASAQQQLEQGQLTVPGDGSALASYRAILEIDPGNSAASSGIGRIEAMLIERARAALQSQDFDTASELLDRAQTVRDGSAEITAARAEITTARQAAWEQALSEIEAEVEAGRLEVAEAAIDALVQSGYAPGERIAAAREEMARVRRLRAYPAGSTFQDDLAVGGAGPLMVVVPNGTFEMGSSSRERERSDNEGPQSEIALKVPFALARTEVTVGDFRRFVEATGYVSDAERNGQSTIYNTLAGSLKDEPGTSWRNDFQGQDAENDHPVVHVSWEDAKAYVDWLAEQTGQPYRLPSEAEFEYALRAGTTSPYWWGNGSPRDEVENLTGEEDKMAGRWQWPNPFERYGDDHWGPAPVASFEANGFGLYDMGGNVLEWTADCYASSLDGIPVDGSARADGSCQLRVLKGGSWASPPAMSRSANRSSLQTTRTTALVGFRVARDL